MRVSIWRHASREPTFLTIPCTAYLPLFIWLYRPTQMTMYLAIGVIAFFAILSKFGLTFKVLMSKLQHWIRGNRIYARPWWYRNRFQDRD
ncbi:conjugal transfer protein TraK [Xenophilus sp. AP218F]|nr:conjugal transfer protein TraK [Xenophilus sp. AP218F]